MSSQILPFALVPTSDPRGRLVYAEPLCEVTLNTRAARGFLILLIVIMPLSLIVFLPSSGATMSQRLYVAAAFSVAFPFFLWQVLRSRRMIASTEAAVRILRLDLARGEAEEWKAQAGQPDLLVERAAFSECRLLRQPVAIDVALGVKAWGVVWHMPSSTFMLCGSRRRKKVDDYVRRMPEHLRAVVRDEIEALSGKGDIRLW